jgi:hypothetical protein
LSCASKRTPYRRASPAHQLDTTLSDSRPFETWSMFAACLASIAGGWIVGRTGPAPGNPEADQPGAAGRRARPATPGAAA